MKLKTFLLPQSDRYAVLKHVQLIEKDKELVEKIKARDIKGSARWLGSIL